MNLYGEHIFPVLLNFVMDRENFHEIRRETLKGLSGVVVEIGFGTGLNLPYYPAAVEKVIAVDPERFHDRYMAGEFKAQREAAEHPEVDIRRSPLVEFLKTSAESLPFADQSIDHVVSTWTLCSVSDPDKALAEVARVLKPGGTYVFAEHGKSPDRLIGHLQDWFTPVQKCIGSGCRLNRNIAELILRSPLKMETIRNFYMQGPKMESYMYVGRARKISAKGWS